MDEHILPKKGMELEKNFSLTLSGIDLEISLDTHKIFHPGKYLTNQDMIIGDRQSVAFTHLKEGIIAHTSMIP